MTHTLLEIIFATLIVSSGSFIGIVILSLSHKLINKLLLSFVSLSAGTMLGAAFLHLLPESVTLLSGVIPFQITLFSFVAFFLLERFLHWRHCHDENHLEKHTLGTMNLIGDGIHNFLDGLLIAASFSAGESLGLVAAFAIIMHEVPQEIGDFGVLLHSGFSRQKALLFNVFVSLMAVFGGVIGYFATQYIPTLSSYLIPIAAGGFIYIGASDLVPEIRTEKSTGKTILSLIAFAFGIILMMVIKE